MSFPQTLIRRLIAGIDALNTGIGRAAAWLCLAMVLATFVVVLMRNVLAQNSIALQESVQYFHGLLFMLGAAWTLKLGGHVRVDLLYPRFSPRQQAMVGVGGFLFLLLPVCIYFFWVSWDYVALSWRIGERSSEAGGLAGLYWLKSLLLVLPVLLGLQGLSEALKSLCVLLGWSHVAEAHHA